MPLNDRTAVHTEPSAAIAGGQDTALRFPGYVNPDIAAVEPYTPGLAPEDVVRRLGEVPSPIVKLASGENPLGASPKGLEGVRAGMAELMLYPDWTAARLRRKVADHVGLTPEHVVCGAGETEIIGGIVRAFAEPGGEIAMARPTFPVYHQYAQAEGRTVRFADGGEALDVGPGPMFETVSARTRVAFVTSPHNPTGRCWALEDVAELCRHIPHALVVLDEAYIHFSERPSGFEILAEYPNLIVLRTFSKAYGLAGLRVGYGVADPEVIDVLMRAKPTWNMGPLQVLGAAAALDDDEHVARTAALVREGRRVVEEAVARQPKLRVVEGSEANYVLLRVVDPELDSTQVFEHFLRRGLVIKDGTVSYLGLGDRHVRIDAPPPEVLPRVDEAIRAL
jgi:histidinol-phosphate aminotransferase